MAPTSQQPHPYVVKATFTQRSNGQPALTFKRGAVGAAYEHNKTKKMVKVQAPMPYVDGRKVTWASEEYFTINWNVVVGQKQLTFKDQKKPSNVTQQQISGTKLCQLLRNFFYALQHDQSCQRLVINQVLRTSDSDMKVICEQIANGIENAGLHDLLMEDEFTLKQLCKKAPSVTKQDLKNPNLNYYNVIYMFNHSGKIYFGKAQDLASRYKGHVRDAKNSGRAHYVAWRESGEENLKLYVVCHLTLRVAASVMDWAELFFVAMFNAFPTWMLERDDKAIEIGKGFAEGTDERPWTESVGELLRTGDHHPGITTEVAQKQSESQVRNAGQRMTAFFISAFVQAFSKVAKWPGAVGRDSFGCSGGLNMACPMTYAALTGHGDNTTIWQRITVPGTMDAYIKHGTSVLRANGDSLYITLVSTDSHAIVHHYQPGKGPAFGTPIEHIMVEVMHNGVVHPSQWARLPDLPETEDWALARSMAIAFLWKEAGQWHKKYAQVGRIERQNKLPCRPYCIAMSLIRALRREAYKVGQNWIGVFGVFSVHTTEFDWLSQTYNISLNPSSKEIELPAKVTVPKRIEILQRVGGASNIAVSRTAGMKLASRQRCDACYASQAQCIQAENSESCKYCIESRLLTCTWTPKLSQELRPKLMELLTSMPAHNAAALTDVEDPQMHIVSSVAGVGAPVLG